MALHQWHMLVCSCVIDNIRTEVSKHFLHTFAVAHIGYHRNETRVRELIAQVQFQVMQRRLRLFKQDNRFRIVFLHLAHEFATDTTSCTGHHHHFLADDIAHVLGVDIDRRTLQQIFDLNGIDTHHSFGILLGCALKLREVRRGENMDIVVNEQLQVLGRIDFLHLNRRHDHVADITRLHVLNQFLVEREHFHADELEMLFVVRVSNKSYRTIRRVSCTAKHLRDSDSCRFGAIDQHFWVTCCQLEGLEQRFDTYAQAEEQNKRC